MDSKRSARLVERLLCAGVTEGEEAAAVTEQGVGAFGDVPEPLPAHSSFDVQGRGTRVVACVFGELGVGGAQGVLAKRIAWFEPVGEPPGARSGSPSASAVRSMCRELSGVVGGLDERLAYARSRLAACAPAGARQRRAGRRRRTEGPLQPGRAWRFCLLRLDEPIGDDGGAFVFAASEVGRQFDRTHPDQEVCSAARLDRNASRAGSFERLLGTAELNDK